MIRRGTALLVVFVAVLWTAASAGEWVFVYDDLDRFERALEAIEAGADAELALAEYFEQATPGLLGWIDIYGVERSDLAESVVSHPRYFRALADRFDEVRAMQPEISRGYESLRRLRPEYFETLLPTYYFVTDLGGGGSVREPGVMIALDYYGYSDDTDLSEFPEGIVPAGRRSLARLEDVPHTAVHELVHFVQRTAQGLDKYVSIYRQPERGTLLAYAIREGGAEFVTTLASGLVTRRDAYAREHEQALWRELAPDLDRPVSEVPGWFSGRSEEHPEWPWQIGYSLGHLICEEFYRVAEDKEAALEGILNASEPAELDAIVGPYRQRMASS